jgi:hypothetical protein
LSLLGVELSGEILTALLESVGGCVVGEFVIGVVMAWVLISVLLR